MNTEFGPKRVGLLHELLPQALRFGVLVNPSGPALEAAIRGAQTATASIGGTIEVLSASTNREIDVAFTNLVEKRVEALLVFPATLFLNRRVQLANLAARHAVPAIFSNREIAEVGGLMSYATSLTDQFRQVGIYVGRILDGRETGRPARDAADQVRLRHQLANGAAAWPHRAADAARHRRRGD